MTAAVYDLQFMREMAQHLPYEPLPVPAQTMLRDISKILPASTAGLPARTAATPGQLFGNVKRRQPGGTTAASGAHHPATPPPTVLTQAKDDPAAKVRLLLNKLTDKNYDEYCNTVIRTLTLYDITDANAAEIIAIALSNQFYIKMYARLYAAILAEPRLTDRFRAALDRFIDAFKTAIAAPIVYVTPNENYDRFCEMNAEIARRKATTEFLVNLAHTGSIPYTDVFDIARTVLDATAARLYDETAKPWLDDLCEHAFLICTDKEVVGAYQGSDLRDRVTFADSETGAVYNLVGFIGFLTKCSIKVQRGLTSKSKFKYADTFDAMKLVL